MPEKKVAFDLADLMAKLKAKGLEPALDGAEKVARGAIDAVFEWGKEGIAASSFPFKSIISSAMDTAHEYLIEQADKIDGKDN